MPRRHGCRTSARCPATGPHANGAPSCPSPPGGLRQRDAHPRNRPGRRAPGTAACEITWHADTTHARLRSDYLDDDCLLALIQSADKVGVDRPFGWPQPFIDAVAAHAHGAFWPGRGQPGAMHRHSLRYRLTDQIVHQQLGVWPLSMSTDRIGVTAMRCAALLDVLAAAGQRWTGPAAAGSRRSIRQRP